jgi:hypothetical protein
MRLIAALIVILSVSGCGEAPGAASTEGDSVSQTVTAGPVVTVEPGHGVDGLKNCKPLAVAVPHGGLTIPFSIDPGTLSVPYLSIEARTVNAVPAAADGLELDEDGSLVRAGWDVCVGHSYPTCFANLELRPGRAVRSFTLRVTPRSTDGRSPSLKICLFEGAD